MEDDPAVIDSFNKNNNRERSIILGVPSPILSRNLSFFRKPPKTHRSNPLESYDSLQQRSQISEAKLHEPRLQLISIHKRRRSRDAFLLATNKTTYGCVFLLGTLPSPKQKTKVAVVLLVYL